MIQIHFRFAQDRVVVEINGNNILFCTLADQSRLSTIEGLRINRDGVIKEFPDLADDDDWKDKAIKRLKDHIKNIKTDEQKAIYIIQELKKYGYEPLFKQRRGFRAEKIII